MAEASTALQGASRERLIATIDKLAGGVQSARKSLKRFRDAAEDPAKIGGEIVAGAAGAALSGVIAGLTPVNHKFQYYDTALGALVALSAMATTGSYAADVISSGGIGLYAPGLSRMVATKIHAHRGR